MDINLISIIGLYIIIAILLIKNRHKIERQFVALIYRTKRGLKLIDSVARFRRFWVLWGYIGIPIGFLGMSVVVFLLAKGAVKIFTTPSTATGISLVIPGVHVPGSSIFVPFWYGIISLAVVILVHEGAHGIVARAHKIKLKSTGLGLLIALPFAFVEPDEEQMKKMPLKTQISVFAAGPFANICTALIVILLSAFLLAPAIAGISEIGGGIYVTDVTEPRMLSSEGNFPAFDAGLEEGDIINGVNNKAIGTTDEFISELNSIKPGEKITLTLEDRVVEVTTSVNPKNETRAYVGLSFKQNVMLKESVTERFGKFPWILFYLAQLFYWLFTLNIGIGLVNLLPLGPLDGGRMVSASLSKMKNTLLAKKLFTFLSLIALGLLVLNIIGPAF